MTCLYAWDASRNYDPAGILDQIKAAHYVDVDSADDAGNPPELGIPEEQVKKLKRGRFVLLRSAISLMGIRPTYPPAWKQCLAEATGSDQTLNVFERNEKS